MRLALRFMAAIAALFSTLAHAQIGPEFQVNTHTTDFQVYPSAAADSRGNFVIVWASYDQDGYYGGIFGQRLDRDGNFLAGEFQVNQTSLDDQYFPSVAAAPDGRFVVVWSSYYQDGSDFGIFGQRFNANGTAVGEEFQVNTETLGYQGAPAVAVDNNGNFLVVWASVDQDGDDMGIFGQRFSADGTPLGSEFQVNTYTEAYQGAPSVTSLADGSFVVAWTSADQDGDGYGIFGRRISPDGLFAGGEMRLNSRTTFDQTGVALSRQGSGFVAVWESFDQDGAANAVVAQRFDASGNRIGNEFVVNTFTIGSQDGPAVGADAAGNFVVVWSSAEQDGDASGVFGQRFDTAGRRVSSEFQVNSTVADRQTYPTVAVAPDGNFLVAWSSFQQDGDLFGIFAQRYGSSVEPTSCTGDCNRDRSVSISELILGVNIALGIQPATTCPAFDRNQNGEVTVDELIQGVNAALLGCPA